MTKTAELIRLLTVMVLITFIVGLGGYFGFCFDTVLSGRSLMERYQPELSEQARVQADFNNRIAQNIVRVLEKTTGYGTVQASVRADLDLTKKQVEDITADTYSQTTSVGQYIRSLSVGVLIDGYMTTNAKGNELYQARSRADMSKYRELVEQIVGFDKDRGDTLKIINMPFEERNSPRLYLLIYFAVLFGGAVLLLLFFVLPMFSRLTRKNPPARSERRPRLATLKQQPAGIARVLHYWLSFPEKPKKHAYSYSKPQQAGIAVLALGSDTVTQVFANLCEKDIKKIGSVIERLGPVAREDVKTTLYALSDAVFNASSVVGTTENMKSILSQTLPKETKERIYSAIRLNADGQDVWSALALLDNDTICTFLSHKSPETTALILMHLPDKRCAELLQEMPSERAGHIMVHLAHIRYMGADDQANLEKEITPQIWTLLHQSGRTTGLHKASAILKKMSPEKEDYLMTAMKRADAAVQEEIKPFLMRFEDFLTWPDDQIKNLLKYSDKIVMAIALKNASSDLKAVFARNMPDWVWADLTKQMNVLSPAQLLQENAARETILKTARHLMKHPRRIPS